MFKRARSLLVLGSGAGPGSNEAGRRAQMIDQFGKDPRAMLGHVLSQNKGKSADMVEFEMEEINGNEHSLENMKRNAQSIFSERPIDTMGEDQYITVYGALHEVLLPSSAKNSTDRKEARQGLLDVKANIHGSRVTPYQTHMTCLLNEDQLGIEAQDMKSIWNRLAPLLATQNISTLIRENHFALAFPSIPADFTLSFGQYGAEVDVLNDLLYEEDREKYRGAFGSDFDLFVRKELAVGNSTLINCAHGIDDQVLSEYPVEYCPPFSFWLSYLARLQREAPVERIMTDSVSLKSYALSEEALSTVWTRATSNPTFPAEDMNGLLQVRNYFKVRNLQWEEGQYVIVD